MSVLVDQSIPVVVGKILSHDDNLRISEADYGLERIYIARKLLLIA